MNLENDPRDHPKVGIPTNARKFPSLTSRDSGSSTSTISSSNNSSWSNSSSSSSSSTGVVYAAVTAARREFMFCNLDELMKSLLCFSHYITDQFCKTCDKRMTWYRTTIFIPCDKMSGEGDGFSASGAEISPRGFRAIMCQRLLPEKCFQECFQSLNTAMFSTGSSPSSSSSSSSS